MANRFTTEYTLSSITTDQREMNERIASLFGSLTIGDVTTDFKAMRENMAALSEALTIGKAAKENMAALSGALTIGKAARENMAALSGALTIEKAATDFKAMRENISALSGVVGADSLMVDLRCISGMTASIVQSDFDENTSADELEDFNETCEQLSDTSNVHSFMERLQQAPTYYQIILLNEAAIAEDLIAFMNPPCFIHS